MVNGTKGYSELIADLKTQPARLRVSYVMGVRWRPSADGAGLAGDVAQMLFAANSSWFTDFQDALVNFCGRALLMLRTRGASCRIGLSRVGFFGESNGALLEMSDQLWGEA